MGADTKVLRSRIKSINSTLHLTNAMGLVASSKIKNAVSAMTYAKDYEYNLETVLKALSSSGNSAKFSRKTEENRTKLIVISSDRGLCGGCNAGVIKAVSGFPHSEIIPIGFRACEKFSKEKISSEFFDISKARNLANSLCDEYASNKYDKLGIIGTKYISVMTQETFTRWLFPLSEDRQRHTQIITEPCFDEVFNYLIREYVAGVIFSSVKESFAGEVAARKTAMDSADKNGKKMLDGLRLEYNRVRQSAITSEISEIAAGCNLPKE